MEKFKPRRKNNHKNALSGNNKDKVGKIHGFKIPSKEVFMKDNKNNKKIDQSVNDYNVPEAESFPGKESSAINNPNIELPAFNPPVPNRAWTAMRQGLDIDELTEQEKADMYLGRDSYF